MLMCQSDCPTNTIKRTESVTDRLACRIIDLISLAIQIVVVVHVAVVVVVVVVIVVVVVVVVIEEVKVVVVVVVVIEVVFDLSGGDLELIIFGIFPVIGCPGYGDHTLAWQTDVQTGSDQDIHLTAHVRAAPVLTRDHQVLTCIASVIEWAKTISQSVSELCCRHLPGSLFARDCRQSASVLCRRHLPGRLFARDCRQSGSVLCRRHLPGGLFARDC
ncbi:hypothetical protein ElyMa_001545300 [Elysia marginata]|uniref:Uncharacterized protein n=1 Tax=Elysia marginata TaxID=1093978 RepID=A0AAV4J9H8_9GAST|nr:hypothetical protein ElyMa_001545300 [Elysia marginata]